MGQYYLPEVNIQFNPPPSPETEMRISTSPTRLGRLGLNLPVAIYPAKEGGPDNETAGMCVYGHVDTGASVSSIAIGLADYMGLIPAGISSYHTAAGPCKMPIFVIDLYFPHSTLSPAMNLRVGSSRLDFKPDGDLSNPQNFGILIGRDIMSKWSIFWNGPTSTAVIID